MSDKPLDIQNIILNQCRREGASVSLYLLKGVRLQGTISGFDPFVITLRRDGQEQLVYKHGIATLAARIALPEWQGGGQGEGLQGTYLERQVGQEVDSFLVNGLRLSGSLRAHDRFTVLIEGPNRTAQLIYKHALSSISNASSAGAGH